MKYLKVFEKWNIDAGSIITKVTDGDLIEIDDIVYHPEFGKGKVLNTNRIIAEILFFNCLPKPKYIRIDAAGMQIDKDVYDLRANAKKYNL